MKNRTLLEKAQLSLNDLTVDGGILTEEVADRFIRLLIKRSVLMSEGGVQVVPMNSPQRRLETLRFAGRVLRKASPGVALASGDRVKPDTTRAELDTVEFKAEARLDDSVVEDNIERGNLPNTVMQALGAATARDMEFVIWNGDTASVKVGEDGDLERTLDGVRKQISTNIYPHGTNPTNTDLWNGMLKALPSEFHRRPNLKFFTSVISDIDWRNSLAARQTPVGDRSLTNDAMERWGGINILAVPEAPEDLGGGSDETEAVLTDPKNIAVGIQRQIRIETARDISAGELIIVVTLRFDVKLVFEPAAVKATGVLVA